MTDWYISKLFNEWSLTAMILRMTFAAIAGVIIGTDRSVKRRGAGIKTHAIVCIGSALVMMTGQYIYMNFNASNYIDRLPAQVIAGVGFLGVGTILVTGHNQVKGLTTAAGLWTCACVGLAIGIGFLEGALYTVILIVFCFNVLSKFDNWLHKNSKVLSIYVEVESNKALTRFIDELRLEDVKIENLEISKGMIKDEGPNVIATIHLNDSRKREALLDTIRHFEYVHFLEEL